MKQETWQDGYDTGYGDGKTGAPKYVPKYVPKKLVKFREELGIAQAKQYLAKEMLAALGDRRRDRRENDRERYSQCQQGYRDIRNYFGSRHHGATETMSLLRKKIRALENPNETD